MRKVKVVVRYCLLLCLLALLALPLTASADDDVVFASIRLYDGINPSDQSEIARRTADGFLPIMRGSDGFVGYFLMPAGDKLAAISLFDSPQQAAASNLAAREFVVENLTPLLPNPPTIHEGTIELEARGDMMQGTPSSLYGSLRVYSDFDMAHFNEANEMAKSGLVPDLLAIDGFFAQYTVATTGSAVVAISIYDSPAAAAEANDSAIAFTREHIAPWSPNDPTGFSGGLAIAALADTADGANLIARKAFASVRVYEGIDPADQAGIFQPTAAGFLPIIRQADGFIAYFFLPAEDMLATVSIFGTAEQADASNAAAADFIAENLAPLLPNPPTIVQGPMDTGYFALLDDAMTVEEAASLYASLRVYVEVDLSQRAETTALTNGIFLPILQEADGFWGYVRMHDGESHSVALSIYDSEANALAANEKAAAFVAEYLTDRPDQVPLRVNGQLAVAALADVNMGENLVGMMDG